MQYLFIMPLPIHGVADPGTDPGVAEVRDVI